MKMLKVSIILVGAVLVFSSSSRAGDTNKAKLHLADKVIIEGKNVDPGDYTVEWTGSGPAVEVSLVQGKHTIATFPAHVTEQANPNAADAYAGTSEPDGSKALTTIYFGGKRTALQLGGE